MELIESLGRLYGWPLIPIIVFFTIATITDIQSKKIRNWTTGGLAVFNSVVFILVPAAKGDWSSAGLSILGGLLAFSILLFPAAYFVISMGGDIKLAGAAGIALGGLTSVLWVLLSAGLVIVYGTVLVKLKGKSRWDTVPFAPFFFISFLILLAGHGMWFT